MQRGIATSVSVIIGALLLVGCGASPATDDPNNAGSQPANSPAAGPDGASGTAVLSYGDTTYTATLRNCMLSSDDALFHGEAFDDTDTQVGYLSGDFGDLRDAPHGEARLDFGATRSLQSMDEFIAMGTAVGQIVVTSVIDTSIILVGGVWDENGSHIATATLKVTC